MSNKLRFLVLCFAWASLTLAAEPDLVSVDYRKLISRGDVSLDHAAVRSEDGLPVGTGRMGSRVWTERTSIRMQINRVDIFAFNSYSGEARPNKDYCCGAGAVSIDFGEEVFPTTGTRQHLSLYDAEQTVAGQGVVARVLAGHAMDVIALEIEDRRTHPLPVTVELRTLRPPLVKTGKHSAESRPGIRRGRLVLTQVFTEPAPTGIREGDHYAASVVVVAVSGRKCDASAAEDRARCIAPAGRGKFTVLIGSSATFDKMKDIAASADSQVTAAERNGYRALFASNQAWWHAFWAKSFVHLHSADGKADSLESSYFYYLYNMGASSRGSYPPKFNGMIWLTHGDERVWGSQYWWWDTQSYYRAPMPANHLELMEPVFNLYSAMYEAEAVAARQQWGSKGIFIPETVAFNGLERLPDWLASELRDLVLERKPWAARSKEFDEHLKTVHEHSSRWDFQHSQVAPYFYTTHIFSSGAKVAYLYWQRYEYTLDKEWLRNRAYPMLKGVAEFYCNYPNLKKETDGKYHIHNVNSHEPLWGAQDTAEEIWAMRGILPIAVRASEILGIDAELRPKWRDVVDHLASVPTSDEPDAVLFYSHPRGLRTWAEGRKPYRMISDKEKPTFVRPCVHYDLWTLETNDPEMTALVHATFEAAARYRTLLAGNAVADDSEIPIAAAMLGRAEDVERILPLEPAEARRGMWWWGVGNIGIVSTGMQLALLQSVAPGPGDDPVIRVFPAWPRKWDAAFRLAAKGGFLVASSIQNANIRFVEIESTLGGHCRMRNPWADAAVTLYRKGRPAEELLGSLLTIATSKGERLILVPRGVSLKSLERRPTAVPGV